MPIDELTVAQLLSLLAAREPAPGGGSAAALAGAIAAALTEMSVAFARGRPRANDHRWAAAGHRAAALRAELMALAEADRSAYGPVLAAMALPAQNADRAPRLRAALSAAAQVPCSVAARAAELAELGAGIARDGSPHLKGDAITAVLLADAAAGAGARLVALNLHSQPEDERLREVELHVKRAAAARAAALADP